MNKKQLLFLVILIEIITVIFAGLSLFYDPNSFWEAYILLWKIKVCVFLFICLAFLVSFICGCVDAIWDKLGDVKTE